MYIKDEVDYCHHHLCTVKVHFYGKNTFWTSTCNHIVASSMVLAVQGSRFSLYSKSRGGYRE